MAPNLWKKDGYTTFESPTGLVEYHKSSSFKVKAVALGLLLATIGAFVGLKGSQAWSVPQESVNVKSTANEATNIAALGFTLIGSGNCKDANGWLPDFEKFGETKGSCIGQCSSLQGCMTAAFTSSDGKCMLRFRSKLICDAASLPSDWTKSCSETAQYSGTTQTVSTSDTYCYEKSASVAGIQGPITVDSINPATQQPWKRGDHYRLMFATSTGMDATSADINDYNTFVQDAADSSPLNIGAAQGIFWKALAATETVSATANTGLFTTSGTGVSVFLVDRLTLVNAKEADLFDSSGACPLSGGMQS